MNTYIPCRMYFVCFTDSSYCILYASYHHWSRLTPPCHIISPLYSERVIYTIEAPRRAHKDHLDGMVKDTRKAWNDTRNVLTPLVRPSSVAVAVVASVSSHPVYSSRILIPYTIPKLGWHHAYILIIVITSIHHPVYTSSRIIISYTIPTSHI